MWRHIQGEGAGDSVGSPVPFSLAGALPLWWRGCIGRPQLGMPVSTVGKVLRRLGLGKLAAAALEPKPPVVRYQPEQPGELIHIDVKKLGRIEAVGHRIIGNPRDRRLVAAPGCATVEPSPIPRAPTVRPSGSFRLVRASGPNAQA